jgi:hypothetical protein
MPPRKADEANETMLTLLTSINTGSANYTDLLMADVQIQTGLLAISGYFQQASLTKQVETTPTLAPLTLTGPSLSRSP